MGVHIPSDLIGDFVVLLVILQLLSQLLQERLSSIKWPILSRSISKGKPEREYKNERAGMREEMG